MREDIAAIEARNKLQTWEPEYFFQKDSGVTSGEQSSGFLQKFRGIFYCAKPIEARTILKLQTRNSIKLQTSSDGKIRESTHVQ